MPKSDFFFIDQGLVNKLKEAADTFIKGDTPPEQFLMRLKELLPVHKTDRQTWKARVEGFSTVSELLLDKAVRRGQEKEGETWDRDRVISQAKLRPLSYWHYVTGSREPAENVMTPEDYFNDPTTALVKLEDDILSLGRLFRKL